jgi:hypothetical protein
MISGRDYLVQSELNIQEWEQENLDFKIITRRKHSQIYFQIIYKCYIYISS